jgi:tetratricopeptide (TPR) repeat protein
MLELAASENDRLHRRNALTLIGNAALAEGRTGDAITALSQALGLCQGQGATWHLATSLLNLGTARMREGRTAEAEELFTRALSIYQALGDQHFTARVLIQLGYAALTGGQPDKAAVPIRQAMEISAQLADAWSIADGLHAVANLRSHDGAETAAYLAAAARPRQIPGSLGPRAPGVRRIRCGHGPGRNRLARIDPIAETNLGSDQRNWGPVPCPATKEQEQARRSRRSACQTRRVHQVNQPRRVGDPA